MNPFRLLLLPALCGVLSLSAQNAKKVYADYHGVRYTRAHDGKLGRWEMHADTHKSATGRQRLCYNADFCDSLGRRDLAAVASPAIGMQSDLDPHAIEYRILAAKTAGIDGFFVEWGFMGHENDLLLRAMQPVAAKYGFEIGVNWCDGWLYYDWITRLHPHIVTREQKTDHYARCYQYLVDSVLSGPTAPRVGGRPVFYLFGPGASPEEYARAVAQVRFPEGEPRPVVLRRWAEWGRLVGDRYEPVRWSPDIEAWRRLGAVPAPWLPARVRPRDEAHAEWDHWASPDDCVEFMKPFRDSVWLASDPAYSVKAGFVAPGMDNRGCAGWGAQHFYLIPRDGGRTYERLWRFCLDSRDSLDMVFIASWSDYTEGHEIEPTLENGDRELRTTLRCAAAFKGVVPDSSGLELPARLFAARKRGVLLAAARRKTAGADALLDRAALSIARADYADARQSLAEAEAALGALEKGLKARSLDLAESDLRFSREPLHGVRSADPELKVYFPAWALGPLMTARTHSGCLEFEFFDGAPDERFAFVYSRTDRAPKELFATVAKFRTGGSGRWKRVRVELAPGNVLYDMGSNFTFMFKGPVRVRNVSFHYTLFR
ncbi:MAG: hypothetical protein K2I13_04560 [Alistipes sp.]|nr:hypothetical protein [Alistipes sp.]